MSVSLSKSCVPIKLNSTSFFTSNFIRFIDYFFNSLNLGNGSHC